MFLLIQSVSAQYSIPSVSRQTWHPVIIFCPSGYTLQNNPIPPTYDPFDTIYTTVSALGLAVGEVGDLRYILRP